jgi:MFS family permease
MASGRLNEGMRGLRASLGLEANIVVLLAALLLMGLGEELWAGFVPKVLEAFGAGAIVWTAYQSIKDLLDAIYQYPGGLAADRLGTRRALVLFNLLAIAGYLIYLAARHWAWILIGTLLVAAWGSMSLPATFAVIGEGLREGRRAIGFSVQSILKRVPIVIAPAIGGLLLAGRGVIPGFRLALIVTIALAVVSLLVQGRLYARRPGTLSAPTPGAAVSRRGFGRGALSVLGPSLRGLLVSDILARAAEGIPEALVVIYATTNLGASIALYGALRGLQMLVSILSYLPGGKLADRWSPRPMIALTFAFFGLFPLAFAAQPALPGLPVAAFLTVAAVLAGLREIGEPARKALIVDLADPSRRGEAVGAYYLVRGLSVAPAPLVGGLLWGLSPQAPFVVAAAAGAAGCIWFIWRGPRPSGASAEEAR